MVNRIDPDSNPATGLTAWGCWDYNKGMTTTTTHTTATIRGKAVTVTIKDTTFTTGQRQLTVWQDGYGVRLNGMSSMHTFVVRDGTVNRQALYDAPKFAANAVRGYLGMGA